MSDVKREYERIEQLIRNRKVRAERNGKEHLLDKLKAKKGMQLLKDEGRIEKYDPRFYYKRTELEIWRRYREIGPEYKEWLGVKNPDISKIFDEVDMQDRGRKRKMKNKRKRMKKKSKRRRKKKRKTKRKKMAMKMKMTQMSMSQMMVIGESKMAIITGMGRKNLYQLKLSHPGNLLRKKKRA